MLIFFDAVKNQIIEASSYTRNSASFPNIVMDRLTIMPVLILLFSKKLAQRDLLWLYSYNEKSIFAKQPKGLEHISF